MELLDEHLDRYRIEREHGHSASLCTDPAPATGWLPAWPLKPIRLSADPSTYDRQGVEMSGSMTMVGMIAGSTIGGLAPMLIGGGIGLSLIGTVIGGVLGIWLGLRANEWFS